MDKIDLRIEPVAEDKRTQLKQLLPEVFTESLDESGNPVEGIDWEKLKAALGEFSEVFENRRERYGMNWPGKRDAMRILQQRTAATLKPCRDESVDFDATQNLFLEGDNLEVLRLLQKSYFGKVKMIYIDPPYNTGKDFVYKDNYHDNLANYLELTGQTDEEGRKLTTNAATEGRYHTNWLNMMYPRLYLARNLLREDGVIFISIDDNEVDNLKKLCNEVFGEGNFIAQFVWERAYAPKNDAKFVSNSHDYVVMYSKFIDQFQIGRLPRTEDADARYRNPDNDPRGVWKPSDLSVKTYNSECDYPITAPSGRVIEPPAGRCWSLSKKAFFERLQDNRIWFGPDGNSVPSIKRFLKELKYEGMAPTSILFYKEVGHSQEGAKEVVSLFDGRGQFDGPKPKRLLERLLILAQTNPNDIILDFFSGSSTTAHAVLAMNQQDGGNRRFVMVQMPEPTDEKSEAYKAGYDTIAEIGKERIRRVIQKIKTEQAGKEPTLPGLEEAKAPQDLGFRVFKLARSNFRVWQDLSVDATDKEILDYLHQHVFHLDENASEEDILFEILLKAGYTLTEPMETLELAGLRVYSIAGGALMLCLENEITQELVDEVVARQPMQFICLDSAFHGNDQLKANAAQTFKALNEDRADAEPIIFRTV